MIKNLSYKQKGFTTTSSHSRGFTLIELLVVIGILAVLLAITLIAINPARQFSQANDTQRRSDVSAILNAIHQYMADNDGDVPGTPAIDTTVRTITDAGGAADVDLCPDLVTLYLADIPLDPTAGTETPAASVCEDVGADYNTGYTVVRSATDNRITVTAPSTEIATPDITVTR